MLRRIEHVEGFGAFRAFTWDPDALEDMTRRNLIYGWNYAGKTTLSRVIRDFEERRRHPKFPDGQATISFEDGGCRHRTSKCDATLPFAIRVFNSDFVESVLRWDAGVAPILILGTEAIDLEDRMQQVDQRLEDLEATLSTLDQEATTRQDALDREATQTARTIRETLGIPGFNRSPQMLGVIDRLGQSASDYVVDGADALERLQRLSVAEARTAVALPEPIPSPPIEATAIDEILGQEATRELLPDLPDSGPVEDWVRAGLRFNHPDKPCRYCRNPISEDRNAGLAAHFSDSYERIIESVADATKAIESYATMPVAIEAREFLPDLEADARALVAQINARHQSLVTERDRVLGALRAKVRSTDAAASPVRSQLAGLATATNELIDRMRQLCASNNERVAQLDAERDRAKARLHDHAVANFVVTSDWHNRLRAISRITRRRDLIALRITRLRRFRERLAARVNAAAAGAHRINQFLRAFFGKDDLRIALRNDGHYQLLRGDEIAETLSEGEKTAIALAYFFVSLESDEANLEQTLVWLDDPISSLDSNHLYNVHAVIRETLLKARQLVVSTHSFPFFKLLQSESIFRPRDRDDNHQASLYYVSREAESGSRLSKLPDQIAKYDSEYHWLFATVSAYHDDPASHRDLEIALPNLIRRLLEVFTSFCVPNTAMSLEQRLRHLCADAVASRRIYKFANHLSHSRSMENAFEFPSATECEQVVAEAFDMMSRNARQHFDGMRQIC